MLVTLLGSTMPVRPVQPRNALSPMLVTLLPMVTLVKPEQPENAAAPMPVTPSPITTIFAWLPHGAVVMYSSLAESYCIS